jgi:hypothetical protein
MDTTTEIAALDSTRKEWRAQNKWNAGNRDKLRAHRAVAAALRRRELKRGKCEVCGSFRVDAHHDDYTLPLVVRWFCRKHHQQLHAEQRRASK